MGKKLLTFFVFVLTVIGMKAQSWTAPTLSYSTDEIPQKAYFYHIGQNMFFTKGTTWGTHSALTKDASTALLYEIQNQGEGVYKLYSAGQPNTAYLGRADNGADLYVDYKNQASWSIEFEFYKAETGFYRIRTAATSAQWGANLYSEDDEINYGLWELGWNPNNDDVDKDNNSLGTNVGVFMLDPTLEGVQLDWAFVTEESFVVYAAQQGLYNALIEAYNMGYTEAELSAYASKLTSTDTEELATATAAVEKMILDFAYNHASPDDPYDITANVIVNSTFEGARGAVPEGWICTNMTIQNNKDYYLWDEEAGAASTTELGLKNFAQNWTSSATEPIAASDVHQVISDLPQGTYILEACAIATSPSADILVNGCELYANSGAIHYSAEVANQNGTEGASYPHRIILNFVHMGGDLTIGYGFTPGFVKWFAVDNFKLAYAGPVNNPGLIALTSTLTAAKVYDSEYEETYYYSEETNTLLKEELDKAEEIINGGDSDACMEQVSVLNDIVATIKAEISAYAKLKSLCEQVSKDLELYEKVTALEDMLASMFDQYQEAYDDKTAKIDQIESWVAAYDATLLEAVTAAMPSATEEVPICISVMGKNLDYAENSKTEGWTAEVFTSFGGDGYKVYNHNGEVWQNSYACLQTIENLPAGKYIVKAKAFYREESNAATYEAYKNGDFEVTTYLVANANKQPVVCLAKIAEEGEIAPEGSGYSETEEGSGIWMPNNQQSAEWAFNHRGDDLTCEVSTYLANGGDLTFGTRNDDIDVANNQWSVWTNFQIFYAGKSINGLYDQVQQLMDQASNMDVAKNVAADKKIQDALTAGDNATTESSEETLTAIVNQLVEAIEYAEKGAELEGKLRETVQNYYNLLYGSDIVGSDTGLPNLLENEVMQIIEDESGEKKFESNEQIEQWIADMPVQWFAYVMSQAGIDEANEENPFEITTLIINPNFEAEGSQREVAPPYWTVDAMGQNNGYQDNNTYGNTDATIVLDRFVETWGNGTVLKDGKIAQTLAAALPEGFYFLEVDGKIDGDNGVSLAVITGNITWRTTLTNTADVDHYRVEFHSNGEYIPTVGILVESTNATWIAFDSFKLFYIGHTPTVGVEGIEEAVAPKSTAIYNLAGQRVQKAVRGLYIINGKKVIVK